MALTIGIVFVLIMFIIRFIVVNRRERRLKNELAFRLAQPSPPGIGSPVHAWPSPWENGERSLPRHDRERGTGATSSMRSAVRGRDETDQTKMRQKGGTLERPCPVGASEIDRGAGPSRAFLRDTPTGGSLPRTRFGEDADIIVHVQPATSAERIGLITPSSSLKFASSPKSSPRKAAHRHRVVLYQPTPYESHIAGTMTGSLQRHERQFRSAFDNVFR